MAIAGQRRKRYRKHNFLLNIEGVDRAGFVTCSALKVNVENVEHREGVDIEPENLPGLVTNEDVTLTWGSSTDRELWEWFQQVVDSRKQGGLTDDVVMRAVEIQQLDRDNSVAIRHPIEETYPMSYSFGDWDKNANELTIHEIGLKVRGVQPPIFA